MQTIKLFSISRGYRRAMVWTGDKSTGQRISVSTIRPLRGLTRQERYDSIKRGLTELGMKVPAYKAHEKA